jgi:hypothetical protein
MKQQSKVFTLYFSGTVPGQFTTKLTRLPVDAAGQPVLSRNKRQADIDPSKVEPILTTRPPDLYNTIDEATGDGLLQEIETLLNLFASIDLDSSMVKPTVTETVTVTNTQTLCSNS